jgi:DNA invertase Pin-like site-specific DNA recombinase
MGTYRDGEVKTRIFRRSVQPLLTILDGLAEFERELIKARTAEGREWAKGRGVPMGRRKHKLTPHQQDEVQKRKAEGMSVRDLGRSFNVSPNTISRVR